MSKNTLKTLFILAIGLAALAVWLVVYRVTVPPHAAYEIRHTSNDSFLDDAICAKIELLYGGSKIALRNRDG